MISLAPPPGNLTRSGPARQTLSAVADAVTGEDRAAVDVSTSSLAVLPTSILALRVGGTAYVLEEAGLRSLFMYYTAAFPRLTPAALLMRPGTLARVVADGLTDHAGEIPDTARVRLRTGPDGPSVYAVTPTLAPPYDVDAILRDLADAVPPGAGKGTEVFYSATDSRAVVVIPLADMVLTGTAEAWLRVTIEDGYPCRVSVTCGVGGRDLGDPAPELERRRRSRTDLARPADGLYVETFRAKLAAVPAWVRAKGGPAIRPDFA